MTISLAAALGVISALNLFLFLRVTKLEFEVAKLDSLVKYLMDRGHHD